MSLSSDCLYAAAIHEAAALEAAIYPHNATVVVVIINAVLHCATRAHNFI